MEPKSSLSHSQPSATCPHQIRSVIIIIIIIIIIIVVVIIIVVFVFLEISVLTAHILFEIVTFEYQ
jgi:flagellar basal body-associated protein FliL